MLAKMFGDLLTLVMSFLLERFMLPFVLIGGVLFCMWNLSHVLAKMFGDLLTLVMSFLLERFMLPLRISSVRHFIF